MVLGVYFLQIVDRNMLKKEIRALKKASRDLGQPLDIIRTALRIELAGTQDPPNFESCLKCGKGV